MTEMACLLTQQVSYSFLQLSLASEFTSVGNSKVTQSRQVLQVLWLVVSATIASDCQASAFYFSIESVPQGERERVSVQLWVSLAVLFVKGIERKGFSAVTGFFGCLVRQGCLYKKFCLFCFNSIQCHECVFVREKDDKAGTTTYTQQQHRMLPPLETFTYQTTTTTRQFSRSGAFTPLRNNHPCTYFHLVFMPLS